MVDLPKVGGRRRQRTRAFDTHTQAQRWLAAVLADRAAAGGEGPTLGEYVPG